MLSDTQIFITHSKHEMKKLNIALLSGGDSSEREIALKSAAQIEQAMDHSKYDITVVDIQGRNWNHTTPEGEVIAVDKNDFSITIGDVHKRFDYALIIIHGTPGEDGKLQGYLDIMGVPYSSCSMASSVITFDKISTKQAVRGKVPLAREIFLTRDEQISEEQVVAELGLPLFIKPNASGSSCGVTKVTRKEDIAAAIDYARSESDDVLIEEMISGREIGCGLMIVEGKEYVFPLTEIVSKKDFFDYEAKYTNGMSDEITPAPIDEASAEKIRSMAVKAYRMCRCSGVVRIDFILADDGTPYMIEINTIPGMSAASIVPKQVTTMGMSLGEMFDLVIKDSLK